MNRRAFLAAIGLAPAAAAASVVCPPKAYATGGSVRGAHRGFVGECSSESILPLRRGADGRLGMVTVTVVTDPGVAGRLMADRLGVPHVNKTGYIR